MERKPTWIRTRIHITPLFKEVQSTLEDLRLSTVCEHARCPNIYECFSAGTATFMILGNVCTRNCSFCAVTTGQPSEVSPLEPEKIAQAVRRLALKHVVVTSVTRDDLQDGGAAHFAATVRAIKILPNRPTVEVLTPDFKGRERSLKVVAESYPEVFGHNIETVSRLYPVVRPQARFERSLEFLNRLSKIGDFIVKSGLMLGLGEKRHEITETLRALREVGCQSVSIGQYLRPLNSEGYATVYRFVRPEEFDEYRELCYQMGFLYVQSGPLVRSSYHAEQGLSVVAGN